MDDLLIRGATLVDAHGELRADLAVRAGKIRAIGHDLPTDAHTVLDADGLHLLPGLIDPHVHFNEPGRMDWEGFATGTRALAVGGVTTFFDMPLNSDPPLTTPAAFDAKMAAMQASAIVNGYLWGGLIPHNLGELAALHARGVIGFKAFMSDSGIPEFPAADDDTLYAGMQIIAGLGGLLGVHAESDAITRGLTGRKRAAGATSAADYLASRPVIAELEAVNRALFLAGQTGCRLHIVHVSSGEAARLIHQARQRGVNVSSETCPHYLTFTGDQLAGLGAAGKCAPPLRDSVEVGLLWGLVADGTIPMIASDHSPAPPDMKQGEDWFAIWGGIAGCQSTLAVMLTRGVHEFGLPLTRIAAATSYNTAQRFGLYDKGRLRVGADADLVLIDLHAEATLRADDLRYRHRISPYVGMTFKGQVARTIVGGRTVYADGRITV